MEIYKKWSIPKMKTSQTGRCNDGCDRKISNHVKIQRCKIWRSAQSLHSRGNTPCSWRKFKVVSRNFQAKFLKMGKTVKYFAKDIAICLILEIFWEAFEPQGLYQGSDIVNIQDLVQFVCPFLKNRYYLGIIVQPTNIQVYGWKEKRSREWAKYMRGKAAWSKRR